MKEKMIVAIIGSRTIKDPDIEKHLPENAAEIITGGAKGVDFSASEYAARHGIPHREFLPVYEKFGRAAPIIRNDRIIEEADMILAFWDGKSKGTAYVIKKCERIGKKLTVILTKNLQKR